MLGLAYLEWRNAVNAFRAILRAPLRLLVWAPYLAFVGYFTYARILGAHAGSAPVLHVLPKYTVTIAGTYMALIGATIGVAAGGRISAFRSPAEAVLFSTAGIRPLTMAVWLQLRKIAASPMRWLGGFLYLFAIAAPAGSGPVAIVRSLIAVGLLVSFAMGTELPAFLLSRGRLRTPLRIFGWTFAAIGVVYGATSLLGHKLLERLIGFTHVDPGQIVRALLAGDPFLLGALVLCMALLAMSVALLADDALPELYTASLGALANRSRRNPASAGTFDATATRDDARIPAGALALVWKDWIGFRRGRGTLRLWLAGCALLTLCGAGVGVAKLYFSDPAPIVTLVVTMAGLELVIAPFGASVGLASDLSKPIFWLGETPLRQRVAAWTAARAWRGGVLLGLAPATAGIVTGEPALALVAIPLSLVTYWSLQALGVGLYAIFPNPIDARGPLLIVRLLITTVYVAPAIFTYGIISIETNADVLAALPAAALLVLQGYAVVELASYRFREYGASLSTISRAT